MDKKNFQAQLLELANGICLADCYLTLAGYETFEDKMFYILKAQSKHLVGEDGWVNSAERLYTEVLGQNKKVTKAYTYDGEDNVIACLDHKHFVIVDKNGDIVYDPMGPRKSPYKEITSYRIVEERK